MNTSISLRSAPQPHTASTKSRYTAIKPLITARELEILNLTAYEYSSKEMAIKLHLSCDTIKSHRKNIMTKLGVKNTAGMVRVAFERGLLPLC